MEDHRRMDDTGWSFIHPLENYRVICARPKPYVQLINAISVLFVHIPLQRSLGWLLLMAENQSTFDHGKEYNSQ